MPKLISGTTKVQHGKIVNGHIESNLFNHLNHQTTLKKNTIITGQQIHSTNVQVISSNYRPYPYQYPETDAFITNLPNILLTIRHADCLPVFFHDTQKDIIAIAHSGFKGIMNHISIEVIKKMQTEYNSRTTDIQITIGACAQPCCYTFTDLTIFNNKPEWKPFITSKPSNKSHPEPGAQLPSNSGSRNNDQPTNNKENHHTKYLVPNTMYYIDLPGFLTQDLTNSGIPTQNITDQQICTIHDRNYHSWRYNKSQNKPLELGISYIAIVKKIH